MKAIILAAGRSKRLGQLTKKLPKCLLPLGNTTILQHQIGNLNLNGIHEICIVTGFYEEMIKELCGKSCRYITNPLFDTTNSIYSLWLARQEAKEGFVVLNSDVVFHPQILTRLLQSPHADALSICYCNGLGEEEMKVKVTNEKVSDLSKAMDPQTADGENVGIVKFSALGSRILFQKIDELVQKNIVNVWAPLAFREICSYFSIYAVSTADLPWVEIDFPLDLEKARNEIYPKILSSLK